ncbi:MAG: PqqD family protein [Bacteroidales bacterium]|nr:PqqD family protein [Bacteroidales bacterium]MBN2758800.1 PqqD family protein [Bacteroidales bacterium]
MKLKSNIAISDSGFIFDPVSGDSYTLNPIGKEILSLLKGNKSDKEISDFIFEKYDIEESIFEKNYYDFIGMLSHHNLLEEL